MEAVRHYVERTTQSEFYYCLYDSKKTTPNVHMHKNYEILLVTEGSASCVVSDKSFELTKGDIVFISPFQIHSFTVSDGGQLICMDIHEHIILAISQLVEGKRLACPVFQVSENGFDYLVSSITSFFSEEEIAFRRITPTSLRMKIKGLCYILSADLLEKGEWEPIPISDSAIIDIIQYISDNFKKDITLRDISRDRGYNYQYLSRIFNQNVGMNFKKFLNQYRIEYAYARIQDTNDPLSQIAFESGFQSIRSFDHVCRMTYGKSPSELRRAQKEKLIKGKFISEF